MNSSDTPTVILLSNGTLVSKKDIQLIFIFLEYLRAVHGESILCQFIGHCHGQCCLNFDGQEAARARKDCIRFGMAAWDKETRQTSIHRPVRAITRAITREKAGHIFIEPSKLEKRKH